MYELLSYMYVVQRLCWLGHVVRMEKDALVKRVFDAEICENRRIERPYLRWKDQIGEALSSIGVTNWSRHARIREDWKYVLRKAKTR